MALSPPTVDDEEETAASISWCFPQMHSVSRPNAKLGTVIKSAGPEACGGAKKPEVLQRLAADKLPEGACAAGLRNGVCNILAAQMPDEMAIWTTGHDMLGRSALNATVAQLMPGGVVLAAWGSKLGHPFGWGRLGYGPKPPSLQAAAPPLPTPVHTHTSWRTPLASLLHMAISRRRWTYPARPPRVSGWRAGRRSSAHAPARMETSRSLRLGRQSLTVVRARLLQTAAGATRASPISGTHGPAYVGGRRWLHPPSRPGATERWSGPLDARVDAFCSFLGV